MGTGKKKIEIKEITKASSRMVTFSKRRKGLFKKASELSSITGADVATIVFSPAGKPYSWGDVSSVSNVVLNNHDYGSAPVSNDVLNNHDHGSAPTTAAVGLAGSSNNNPNDNEVMEAAAVVDHDDNGGASSLMDPLTQWLDSIDVEAPYNLDQLFDIKYQLKEIKKFLSEASK